MTAPVFLDGNILYGSQLTALEGLIPTRVSQLVNDSGFITSAGGNVTSVAGRTGAITLTYVDVGGLATVAHTGSFTDLSNVPTIPNNTNQLVNGAAFITASSLATYAPLVSPVFTGNPTAPTQSSTDNSTRLATTGFVTVALENFSASSGSGSVSDVTSANNAITIANPSTTPVLTFVPSNVKTSTLNNDLPFLVNAVTSVSSTSSVITVANGTSTAALTFVPAALSAALINYPVTVITVGTSYTVLSTDYYVVINKGTGSPTAITLTASPITGRTITIKDGKGDAATNNITISPAAGLIDGANNVVIQGNSGSVTLEYNGSQWNILFSTTQATTSSGGSGNLTITTVSSGSSYNQLSSDQLINVNKASGSATAISLAAGMASGYPLTIRDGKGDAASNNITVTPSSGTINGASSIVINQAYGSVSLMCFGSNVWGIL